MVPAKWILNPFVFHAGYLSENVPMKLKEVTDAEYVEHELTNFSEFACSYAMQDTYFDFNGLNNQTIDRFIELLAPLTLYHFAKSSKCLYYVCLDFRGIEHSMLKLGKRLNPFRKLRVNGLQGRLEGHVKLYASNMKWLNYLNVLETLTIYGYIGRYSTIPFVRNYKTLVITCSTDYFINNHLTILKLFFHPGVNRVNLGFEWTREETSLDLPIFITFLSSFTNVRAFAVKFTSVSGQVIFSGDPEITHIRACIESWASKAKGLRHFALLYKLSVFHMSSKGLQMCLEIEGRWHLTTAYQTTNECITSAMLGYVELCEMFAIPRKYKNNSCDYYVKKRRPSTIHRCIQHVLSFPLKVIKLLLCY